MLSAVVAGFVWAEGEAAPDFLLFLGRFHPLIVHLPIGFLLIAFALEVAARLQQEFGPLRAATAFVLLLGAWSAILAAVFGYFLSMAGGYDPDTLFWHQWLGIGVAVTAIVAYLIKVRAERGYQQAMLGNAFAIVLFCNLGMVMGAGHYGGALTHGSDYLVTYMPNPMRTLAGMPLRRVVIDPRTIENVQDAVVYDDLIHPILETRCVSCHNPSKKKGDLRLDDPAELFKGGETGEVVLVGNAEESDLHRRLLLPADDEDRMPPKGKDPLTPEQIQLIGWWIDKGAPLDKKVAELELTPEAELALNRLTGRDKSPMEVLLAKDVAPAKAEDIAKLRTEGAVVVPVAQESSFLHAQFRHTGGSSGDEQLKSLAALKEQLTWLDLAGTSVSDAGLAQVAELPNLTRLHLQKTQVTDAGLVHLKNLEHRSYLNLYGTQITDAGLKQLDGLKNLRSLYLWQTKVTEAGVKALQQKLPGLKVDTGLSAQTNLAAGEKPTDSVKVTKASLQN
ncbi:ribonuclease inhibitor [soil metagenome]